MEIERPTDGSRSSEESLAPGSILLERTLDRLNLFFRVPKKESLLRRTPLLLPRSVRTFTHSKLCSSIYVLYGKFIMWCIKGAKFIPIHSHLHQ